MSTDKEGPLSRLSRMLGLSDLAPIAAVKRIDERPVSLNPETMFKMAPRPEDMSESGIHRLCGDELWKDGPRLPTHIDLTARQYDIEVEFLPSAPADQCFRAIDLNTFDGGPDAPGCFQGYGASSKQARLELLDQFADYDERPRPKPSRVIHSSPFEPPTYSDESETNFDDGLDDDPR